MQTPPGGTSRVQMTIASSLRQVVIAVLAMATSGIMLLAWACGAVLLFSSSSAARELPAPQAATAAVLATAPAAAAAPVSTSPPTAATISVTAAPPSPAPTAASALAAAPASTTGVTLAQGAAPTTAASVPQQDDAETPKTPPPRQSPSDTQKRIGRILMLSGSLAFIGTYALSAGALAPMTQDMRFALPVVGPVWVGGELLAKLEGGCPNDALCVFVSTGVTLGGIALLSVGVLQAMGLGSLVAGAVLYGRSGGSSQRVSVLPYATGHSGGLALGGTF